MPKNNKKPSKKQPSINELKDFHPLVAKWLTDNDYTFVHEYKMPDFGRVDYYAIHNKTGREALIECKCDERMRHAIIQVASYRLQIPEADAIIAVPANSLSDNLKLVAEKYEVGVLEIDTSDVTATDDSEWLDNSGLPSIEQWSEAIEIIETYADDDTAKRVVKTLFLISLAPDTTQYRIKELFEVLCNRLQRK